MRRDDRLLVIGCQNRAATAFKSASTRFHSALPKRLRKPDCGGVPERRSASQSLSSFARHVHGLASLPAFGAEADPLRPLERFEVAAQRGAIHRQSFRQRGDRCRVIHVDRRQNGELRCVQSGRLQSLVVGSGHQSRNRPQAGAGAVVDEMLGVDHGDFYEVHIHYTRHREMSSRSRGTEMPSPGEGWSPPMRPRGRSSALRHLATKRLLFGVDGPTIYKRNR